MCLSEHYTEQSRITRPRVVSDLASNSVKPTAAVRTHPSGRPVDAGRILCVRVSRWSA